MCGCREEGVQTKDYRLRLTIKAYKLSYNYIDYIINLVGIFRLEAFQDVDGGCGGRAPELDAICPDRFEDGFCTEVVFC
jgi:hypothetical protein